jgi:hypothetical protein
MLMVLIAGDFLGMSTTTDNVRPSPMQFDWLIASSVADISIAAILAITGVAIVFAFLMDIVRVPVFRHLGIG